MSVRRQDVGVKSGDNGVGEKARYWCENGRYSVRRVFIY